MKNIARKIVLLVTIMIFIVSIIIILMPFYGIEPTIMLTGSMRPQIPIGSICFVDKKYSYNDLKKNDIIVYTTPQYRVIHRIVEKTDKGYRTKGDSNRKIDVAYITKDIYYGKYLFSIPYAGYIVLFLQNKYGKFFIVAFIIFIVIMNYYLNKKTE